MMPFFVFVQLVPYKVARLYDDTKSELYVIIYNEDITHLYLLLFKEESTRYLWEDPDKIVCTVRVRSPRSIHRRDP